MLQLTWADAWKKGGDGKWGGGVGGRGRRGWLTRYTWPMISTQHDYQLNEPGGVLGQLPLEPQQRDDIPHVVIPCYQSRHGDFVVGGLFTSVITD